jgi:hypothetical protein
MREHNYVKIMWLMLAVSERVKLNVPVLKRVGKARISTHQERVVQARILKPVLTKWHIMVAVERPTSINVISKLILEIATIKYSILMHHLSMSYGRSPHNLLPHLRHANSFFYTM